MTRMQQKLHGEEMHQDEHLWREHEDMQRRDDERI